MRIFVHENHNIHALVLKHHKIYAVICTFISKTTTYKFSSQKKKDFIKGGQRGRLQFYDFFLNYFLASQDALEVMRVTYLLTHLLTKR